MSDFMDQSITLTRTYTQRTYRYPGPFSVGPERIVNVVCADGSLRTAYCSNRGADTFFSIPSRVYVKGKTVAGYVTRETMAGFSSESPNDPAVWKFIAYEYGVNHGLVGSGAYREER